MMDNLLVECSALIKLMRRGSRWESFSDDQHKLIDELLGKIEEARKVPSWLAEKRLFRWLGQRDGVRFAVTWLARRANSMNDAHAKVVLDSAATNLGWAGARKSRLGPHKDPLAGIVNDDMAKAAYEKRVGAYQAPRVRVLTWEELPEHQKETEREIIRAAIGAGL